MSVEAELESTLTVSMESKLLMEPVLKWEIEMFFFDNKWTWPCDCVPGSQVLQGLVQDVTPEDSLLSAVSWEKMSQDGHMSWGRDK